MPGSGKISKITEEIRVLVEEKMRADDETTAVQLHKLLSMTKAMLFRFAPFFTVGSHWVGRFVAAHIASSFEE